jgi:hypothetical protein
MGVQVRRVDTSGTVVVDQFNNTDGIFSIRIVTTPVGVLEIHSVGTATDIVLKTYAPGQWLDAKVVNV